MIPTILTMIIIPIDADMVMVLPVYVSGSFPNLLGSILFY